MQNSGFFFLQILILIARMFICKIKELKIKLFLKSTNHNVIGYNLKTF